MTDQGETTATKKTAPRVLRLLGVFFTVVSFVGFAFFLILIETRDHEMSVRRDVAYGELNRIENRLEDLIAVAESESCSGASSAPKEKLAQDEALGQLRVPGTDEEIEATAAQTPASDVDSASLLKLAPDCDVQKITLTNESRQSRDRRLFLTVFSEIGEEKLAGLGQRTDVSDQIGKDTLGFEVPDVAIVSSDFKPILRLRGDTGWPAELGRIVAEGEAVGWEGLDLAAAVQGDSETSARVTEFAALSGPVSIRLGGAERIAHAVPLSARLPIIVGGPSADRGGVTCAPRSCLIVGLTREQGLIDDFARISPLMRASFGASIVLLLLLVPLAKLVLIEKRSSLHWSDVAAVICAVPLAIAAMFVISLCWAQWLELRAEYDRDSMRIAQMMSQDIEEETESLHRTLLPCSPKAYAGLADDVFLVDEQGDLLSRDEFTSPEPTNGNSAGERIEQRCDSAVRNSDTDPALAFLQRFVAFRDLTQENPPPASVASREYFRSAKSLAQGPSAQPSSTQTPDHRSIVTDIVFSQLDGRSTVVAIRPFTENSGGTNQVAPLVRAEALKKNRNDLTVERAQSARSVLTTSTEVKDIAFLVAAKQLDATSRAKLPADFQFALLDKDSLEVLQHSEASRNGSEFWDKRIGDVGRLKSAIDDVHRQCPTSESEAGRQPHYIESEIVGQRLIPSEPVTLSYAGRDVRVSLRPLCSLGWVTASWYPTSTTERLAVEAGVLPIAIILAIACFAALMALIAALANAQQLLAFFWPLKAKDRTGEKNRDNGDEGASKPSVYLTRGRKALLVSGLFVCMLIQALIVRGDAAFWQIWAVLCVPIALTASPAITDSPDRRGRVVLFICAVAVFGIFSVVSAYQLTDAGFLRQFVFSALAIVVGVVLLLLPRQKFPGHEFRAWLFGRWMQTGTPRRIVENIRVWIDSHDNLSRQIVTQTLIQGVRVGLIAVLPAILAYRAATTPLFEDRIASDIAATNIDASALADEVCDDWLNRSDIDATFILSCRTERMHGYPVLASGPGAGFVFLPADNTRLLLQQVIGRRLNTFEAAVEDANFAIGQRREQMGGNGNPSAVRNVGPGSQQSVRGEDAPAVTAVEPIGAIDPFDPYVRTFFQILPFLFFALMGLAIYAYLNRALFGMALFEFRALHPRPKFAESELKSFAAARPGGPPPLRLYINYPFYKFDTLKDTLESLGGYNLLDLSRVDDAEKLFESTRTRNRPWIVVGLMRVIGAPALRRKALDFLERLVATEGVQIHFFSEMLPIERLQQVRELERLSESTDHPADAGQEPDEARHWAMLLARFVTVRWDSGWEDRRAVVEAINREGADRCEWLDDLIEDEFEAIPNDLVRKQRESFLEELDLKPGDEDEAGDHEDHPPGSLLYKTYDPNHQPLREQVIEYLANVLSDYYQMKWIGSTREEQILMHHLANGRFVKTTDFRTINGLINRDLIKRDPNLKLMNESFAFWVRTSENPESFDAYRRMVEQASPWSQLRFPMLIFVVIAAVALAYLDQGTVGSVISLLPALAAAIPVFASQAGQSRTSVPR